ncbi:MAG: hypothetical protein ACFFDH_04320 [Promethearchaeota archaeon]
MWSGSLDTIPEGWKLCDGTGGTLNTSNRFIYSTDGMEESGELGGTLSHNHSYSTVPYHDHGETDTATCEHRHQYARRYTTGTDAGPVPAFISDSAYTGYEDAPHTHSVQSTGEIECFTADTEDILPPFYKMAFIKKETSDAVIPFGLIVMWSGSIQNIPLGWVLCNGSYATPDLRDRFILGVSSEEDPGALGGTISHNHTYTDIPQHSHSLEFNGYNHRHEYMGIDGDVYTFINIDTASQSTSGTTDWASVPHTHNITEVGIETCTTENSEHIPPYFKIAFIMHKEESDTLPIGTITMWGDSYIDIPSEWHPCNGTNNTPDMRSRFLRGISSGEQPGITGGSAYHNHTYSEVPLHTHTVNEDDMNHYHSYNYGSGSISFYGGSSISVYSPGSLTYAYTEFSTAPHKHDVNPTGSSLCYTADAPNIPPYIKLIYIKKCLSIYNPSPALGATGVNYNPTLSVDVSDDEGDDLYVIFYDALDDSLIGVEPIIGGTGTASVDWLGLLDGTVYSWYVIVEDPIRTTKSDTWVFTTNYVPDEPIIPSPSDGATGIGYNPTLSVDVFDEDGEELTVTFYNASDNNVIGVDNIANGIGTASVTWFGLTSDTSYSWYAIVDDGMSINQSDTWTFTTNYRPNKPTNPSPSDGATGIGYNPTLSVEVFDKDEEELTVTFYNASDDNVIGIDIVSGGIGPALVTWSGLTSDTTYSWYAIADDGLNINQSDTWSFTVNDVPNEPTNPSPSDGATGVSLNPILSVDVSDPEGDTMDVLFYNASDYSLIGTDIGVPSGATASITWLGLSGNTNYEWFVIADDGIFYIQSATWSFTTINTPPDAPINPSPLNGATDIGYNPTLSVDVFDADGDGLTVSFYNTSDDSIIGVDNILSGSGTASVTWFGLTSDTSYSWYAVADDGMSMNQSETWSFTTNYVPNNPTNPSPSDGATDIGFNPTLSVDVLDADGDELTVTFYNASDDSVIGIDTILGGSGTASVSWAALSAGTTYSWYTVVDDGLSTIQSATWSFTTSDENGGGNPPAVSGPDLFIIVPVTIGTTAIISIEVYIKHKKLKKKF